MTIDYIRIDHIAMAVADLGAQVDLLEGLFGFSREGEWEDEAERSRGVTLALPGDVDIRWEVLAPTDAASPVQAFLDSPRGPGLHHVAFEAPDLDATRRQVQALGVREASGSNASRVVVSADGAGEGIQFQFFAGSAHGASTPASTSENRAAALGIVGIDHVCTAYPDRDDLSEHYRRMLGTRQIWRTADGEHEDFGDCVLEMPGGEMYWEVIQPVGDDSFIRTFLDRRGPAVHHVAFEVADFDAALEACAKHDIPTFDEHDDSTDGIRWRDAFIHPKFTGGLLTQFFWEEQPHTWIRSDKVRPPGFAE